MAVGAPVLPLALPVGNKALTFAGTKLIIDESTDTLTLSASAVTADGATGTLSATVRRVSSTTLTGTADLSATVTIKSLPVLGARVDLSGTLAYAAGGHVSASLTGTLTSDLTIAAGSVVITKGSTFKLATSTGLTLAGTVLIGSGGAQFTVAVSGAVADEKNWSISVNDSAGAPSFSPVTGLTLTPTFSGTIADTNGAIGFDVSSGNPVSFTPADGVTLAITHVEVSNQKPPAGVSCPAGVTDGQLWIDASGSLSDKAANISTTGELCIAPATHSFTITGTEKGDFAPANLGFGIGDATVTVTSDGKTVEVTAAATLTLTAVSGAPTFPVTLDFSSDGTFTAGVGADLGALGLGAHTSTGTLLVSSKEIKQFDPSPFGITGSAFDLPAGVTVVLNYQPNSQVTQILNLLRVPVPASVQARASLSTTGFEVTLQLSFGFGDAGIALLPDAPSGVAVYVDSLSLGVKIAPSGGSVTISGAGLLKLPALYTGSTPSSVALTIGGSLALTDDGAVSINVGFDLSAVNGPWTDAFGIPNLSIGELAASVGVEAAPEQLDIPLPTIKFTANNVVLPTEWADAIGELPGTAVSLTLNLDVDNPILSFAISPGPGQTAALEPLRIANDIAASTPGGRPLPESTVDQLQLQDASLLFAPAGGTDATGASIDPGASLVFDAVVGGVLAHIDGSIGLTPYPHLTAHVNLSSFNLGPVSFSGTHLAVDLEGDPANPKVDFQFTGGFTDSVSGTTFSAKIDLGASTSALNAAVTLNIAAGQPQYIGAGAELDGSVYASGTGFGFSASGSAAAYLGGMYIGSVSFSYSTYSGALFQQLQQIPGQIAYWFRNIYGQTDVAVAAQLNQIGVSATQIASTLQTTYGDGEAALFNALQQAGVGGQTAINAVSGFFNTGSYWIYANPWYSVPLYLDDAGGSQAPGNGIIQYTWNGGHNQDWYVLPTDSGYAEIVNRNSGQCLSAFGGAGNQVEQYPCYGWSQQQWYLGIYPGQNLNYSGHNVTNRATGWDLDVNQASTSAGAAIDTWYGNGGWNQWWTFEPAIG